MPLGEPVSTEVAIIVAEKTGTSIWRRLRRTWQRAGSSFRLPRGRTLIVIPVRPLNPSQAEDETAAEMVGDLLTEFGLEKGKGWFVRRLASDDELTDDERKQNLIIVCGSNPVWRTLNREHGGFLSRVEYVDSESVAGRRFLWHKHLYGSQDGADHALLAIKSNPYNTKKLCVAMIGLRAIGSLGAARAYCLDVHRDLRKQMDKTRIGGRDLDLEVLLRIKHKNHKAIMSVDMAREGDGVSVLDPASIRVMTHTNTALKTISASWRNHPRPIQVTEYEYTLTIQSDFAVVWDVRYTVSAGAADVVFLGTFFGSHSAPLDRIEEIAFQVDELERNGSGEWVTKSGGVEYLPALDIPSRKEFLIFPLPPIATGAPPRRYRERAVWPRAAVKLATLQADDLNELGAPLFATGTIDTATFRINFECDGTYEVVWRGAVTHGPPVTECSRASPFVYSEQNMSPGRRLELAVRRVK